MEPITTAVIAILGKYAVDAGKTLLKEVGQSAADLAGKLFQKVLDRLKADPAEAKNAERFEKDPVKHQELISEAIDEKVKAEPAFAAELEALVEEFKKSGGQTIFSGGGAVYTGNDVVVGTNTGTIQYGSGNTVNNRTGGTDINAQGGTFNLTGDFLTGDKKSNE